jgi:transposase, IS6 family
VRWYGRFRLSVADVRDLLAERGIDVSARTVLSWVHTFGPLLAAEARRHARPLGRQWFCDETYVRVSGKWMYLYRAVDEAGQVVDVLLREHRDRASAEAFFQQALDRCGGTPERIITDKHQAYMGAVRRHLPAAEHVRTGLHRARGVTTKPIERSHVPVKDRLRPMRGLQSVRTGQCLIESVELARSVHRGFIRVAPSNSGSRVHEWARACATIYTALGQRLRAA